MVDALVEKVIFHGGHNIEVVLKCDDEMKKLVQLIGERGEGQA
jgi:hypothetical protein